MAGIGESIIFPNPRDQHEEDLYNSLREFIDDVTKILNRGILFSDNMDARLVTFTSNATPDTEDTTAHGLGRVPTGFIVYSQNKAGSLYNGGTAHNATNIYTKCNVASVTFKVIVF
jgi:hypothetical protein